MAAIHQTGFFSLCKQGGLKISDESASGRIWEPACRWLRAPSLTGSPPFRRFLRLKIDRTMYIVRALDLWRERTRLGVVSHPLLPPLPLVVLNSSCRFSGRASRHSVVSELDSPSHTLLDCVP